MLGEQIYVDRRKIGAPKTTKASGSNPNSNVHSPDNTKNSRLTFKFDGVFNSKNKDSQQQFGVGNGNTLVIGDFPADTDRAHNTLENADPGHT